MQTKTAYLLLVATILLIPAGYITTQLIEQMNAKVMVVVAKQSYPKGIAITNAKEMFELREIRLADAPQGFLTELKQLNRRILVQDIRKGEPVVMAHLRDQKLVSLSQVVPLNHGPGWRLILVIGEGREESVRAGTHIDVIETKTKGDRESATILLKNVLVLSVRSAPELAQRFLDAGGKADLVPLFVTLNISAEDAEGLDSVKDHRDMHLEFRLNEDNKKEDNKKSPKTP